MSPEPIQFILASGSPRRKELLDSMQLSFEVISADVDESALANEVPRDYVSRIAASKARWVAGREANRLSVLAADTAVVLNGEIFGKPANPAVAKKMLFGLSGHTHEVLSAVVLITRAGVESHCLSVSRVTMASLKTEWVEAYSQTAEPMDKAGAYAIQGMAAQWVTRLEGSYSGVMGLPLHETTNLLRQAGIDTFPSLR
jgi:septum formation protein